MPRFGSLALALALSALAAATVNELVHFSRAHERRLADLAVFARATVHAKGDLGPLHVWRHRSYDVVCARHRRARHVRADYALCVNVDHTRTPQRVVAVYRRGHRG